MAASDRSLDPPPRAHRRNLTGFSAEPPPRETETAPRAPDAEPEAAPVRAELDVAPPRRTRRRRPASTETRRAEPRSAAFPVGPETSTMVRVHTTLSAEVVRTLKQHTAAADRSQTDILAASFLDHAADLIDQLDHDTWTQLQAAGFRPNRTRSRRGTTSATFYMPETARASLDDAAAQAGFGSRSSFIDALLRRYLQLPD